MIVTVSALLLALGTVLPAQDDDPRRLRDELIKARLETLGLKLQLARLSGKPDDELKILEDSLDSDLAEVVSAGLRELGSLSEDRRKAAAPAVLRRYRGARESFRIEAVGFLGRVPMADAESTVLRSASDGSAAVRKSVAGALKSASAAGAVEALLQLFRDPDQGVRVAALDALGVARRESAVGPLASTLAAEQDPLIIEKTVDALGAIGSPGATDALVELLSTTPRESIRWSCINSLGMIGDSKAGPRLLPFLEPSQPLDVREVTIESLGKLKETSALPRLADLLVHAPEEKLRQSAATAFGMMAGSGSITETLLPAYLAESAESVHRALWAALWALTGDGIAANERLAQAFLSAGRRGEAELLCTRLHGTKPEGELRLHRLGLEETIAASFYEANDFKTALVHFKQIPLLAPGSESVRRVAACQRELKDYDGCLKTLAELRDPEPMIEEAAAQLQTAPGEERRKSLEATVRTGAQHLVDGLSAKDEIRRPTLEAIRRLGRKILPCLIAELEEGPKSPSAVLEAGSVVTGIPNDPTTAGDLKAKAAAWRTWMEH
ncbi:MAG TPA: HEAT repeat domain-containing protein [Planctomycetota bacterium]|nr:HEAT repeat domain-containing protein [Planctomycetota bacterium]